MQFVRTDQVFCFLADVAILVCRYQFGADRCVHDIQQGSLGWFVDNAVGHPLDQMFHQRLGDRGVDAIHAHVVAVVRGPSQSQFRQVAGSHYHAIHLVSHIHQNLRTFACLCVFIRHIMVGHVEIQVLEMLYAGLFDADFSQGYPQAFHKVDGIGVSTVGGSEAGHGHADDAFARESQFVERFGADQ